MPCGNPNCSCSNCSCGDDCNCGRTGLSFSENATTSKIIIDGVAPLKTYYEDSEMNFGEVYVQRKSGSNCDSFGFHK
ncbi:metallothionein-like protein 1B [Rosa rugosa]|uniref:metallothionein-like protein 1B n=1 Tax=Rosa rugosa TaxID=74645 RepID=UPI002B40C5B3|nr:metallothionein-like protein 1B [Rosa rugosa]